MGSSNNLQIKKQDKMKNKNDKWMSIVLWFASAYFLFQIIMAL